MRRSRRRLFAAVALLVLAGAVVAAWPARRKIGVNHVVTEHTLPLGMKTVDFVHRDLNLARTAARVLDGVSTHEERARVALVWTAENVRPQPEQLPIVDDHVWNIVVRGYGEPDQLADVFTTLLVYEGVPAYWGLIGTQPHELPLSYVWLDGRWRVFDVAHRIEFRTSVGDLATPEELAADTASMVRRCARGHVADLDDYLAYFHNYRAPQPPDVLRADLQMMGRRLWFEARKLVGAQGRVWQIRPDPAPQDGEGVSVR